MINGLKSGKFSLVNSILLFAQLLFIFALKMLAEGIGAYATSVSKPIPRLAEWMFLSGSGIYWGFAGLVCLLFITTTYTSLKSDGIGPYPPLSASLILFLQSVFVLALSLLFWSVGLSK
jgi:hypothetical protein